MRRLIEDAAIAAAATLTEMVAPALMPSEVPDYRDEAQRIVEAVLEKYEQMRSTEAWRLGLVPSRN